MGTRCSTRRSSYEKMSAMIFRNKRRPQYMATLATSSNGMRHTSSFGFAVDGTKIDLTRSRLSSISSLILFATSVI